MIRKGLKLILQLHMGFTEVAEVESCNELMRELTRKKYTHLVLDIILSDGSSLEVLPAIREIYPGLRIMVCSMDPSWVYRKALQQYDIDYFLHKSTPETDTIQVLHDFLHDRQPSGDPSPVKVADNPFSNLTKKELQVLRYMLQGEGTKEIAGKLDLKMNTISTFKNHIFEKTVTHNLKELIVLATLHNINY